MLPDPTPPSAYSRRDLTIYALRLLGVLAVVFVLVALLARHFRPLLEQLGHGFVERLGFVGMALGTFLADGFHFPIPPQAYMLMAVSSETSLPLAFGTICIGSWLGGAVAFLLGQRIAHWGWLARKLAPLQHMFERTWDRLGHRALLLASVSPVPYSTLCWLSGMNRLPTSAYWVLALCRVPRLAVFLLLIYAGWSV